MGIVVPISKPSPTQPITQPSAPEAFTLMAAAQMHSEGRLLPTKESPSGKSSNNPG